MKLLNELINHLKNPGYETIRQYNLRQALKAIMNVDVTHKDKNQTLM